MHAGLPWRAVSLAPVAGCARGDDVLPARFAAFRAWNDVVDGEVGARAAVLAGPAVAREHSPARDLAPVRVPGHVDVCDQADDDRPRERRALGVQLAARALHQLGLRLQ